MVTGSGMVTGIIGKKVGMTQLFAPDGTVQPVTVLEAGPCIVVQAKTVETDGYESVQIGLVEKRPVKVNRPMQGHHKKSDVPPTRIQREVKIAPGGDPVKAGDQVNVSMFANGESVDVIGTSRGKGFQGVMKRHNFGGGRASHGSMFHRAPGSIGASAYPSRVIKGMKMPGQMGNKRVTVLNLKVIQVDADKNLLLLGGAVPGSAGGYVVIRKAVASKPVQTQEAKPPKKGKK
tara:strand:+ start:454 stop:1152 length:699 start_codon:yes stop_codon:yes gene_type:complete